MTLFPYVNAIHTRPFLKKTLFEKHMSEMVKPSWSTLINIPHWFPSLGMKNEQYRKT